MKRENIKNMVGGWFVGNFTPSLIKTEAVEVGYKQYQAGDKEAWHVHKKAQEITVIVQGKARMCGQEFSEGEMILLEKGEGTDFYAIEDTKTLVVKFPSVLNDKFFKEDL